MKRTKIVCTLGPASSTEVVLKDMLLAGMNVARFNFSHGTHDDHQVLINKFRKVRDNLGMPAAVMLDTKGPEIRLGVFKDSRIELSEGQSFILTARQIEGTCEESSITYGDLYRQVEKGQSIMIDDGLIKLEVTEVKGKDIHCRVIEGGEVSSRKGVNLPGTRLDIDFLSDADRDDILFGIKNNVDYIAASFVRRATDILSLKNFLNANGGDRIKIIAKIENAEGLDNFEEILEQVDGIMVARGDMGVDVPFEELPGIQKYFIKRCCEEDKVVITATQMLESMVKNPTPTRAEITDVANAVFDGTSAVMLSGESAAGDFPVETVATMSKILERAEKDAFQIKAYDKFAYYTASNNIPNAIGRAACDIAKGVDAQAIVAMSKGGFTAIRIATFKPEVPIITATPDMGTFHRLSMVWGVTPMISTEKNDFESMMANSLQLARDTKLVNSGDIVVVTAGIPLNTSGSTNMIKVERI